MSKKTDQKGVYRRKCGGFKAAMGLGGKIVHLGCFSTFDEAKKARLDAEKRYGDPHRKIVNNRFKPGFRSPNTKRIGSIRIGHRGWLEIKIKEGHKSKNWSMLHIEVWKRVNGKNEVPQGYVVTFKDGDKSNVSPGNLILKSRVEQGADLGLRNVPPELREVAELNAKLKKKIRDAKKRHKHT